MVSKTFKTKSRILHLPIKDSDKLYYVRFTDKNGLQKAEFRIGLTAEEPDFYAPLYLWEVPDDTITMTAEEDGVPENIFDGIKEGGKIEERQDLYPDIYKEPDRQQIHFSPGIGWLNDPNGLVYANGEFRMCFQHNPYGPNHGGVNVSWGLAVSKDGIHFKEYPDAIRPWDSLTHVASGSAIVDEDNVAGYGKDAILAVYTALESVMYGGRKTDVRTRGQMLEVSTDGGYNFKKVCEEPIIPVPDGIWWRDPKILRAEKGSLCIAVYETYEGKNCVSFYTSDDGRKWTFRSRTMDLYECPDLFELPVAETGEKMWVLYGAGGCYRVGRFVNYAFETVSEGEFLDYGCATYAGQTWNSHPDKEGRYHIAWLHDDGRSWYYDPDKNDGTAFSQSMTVMCRFTLHKDGNGYKLFRNPTDVLRTLEYDSEEVSACANGCAVKMSLQNPGNTEFTVKTSEPFSVNVCGGRGGFDYDPNSGIISFVGGKKYTVVNRDGRSGFAFRVITDTKSAELFLNGEVSATFYSPEKEKFVEISGTDLNVTGKISRMRSIRE